MSAEALGGATLHSATSGVTDHFAQDERHALRIARDLVAGLNARPLAGRCGVGVG